MSDFIFIRKSRNALSSFLHLFLNVILGLGSIALTYLTGSFLLGLILVLISKWRMFAVRPRYWLLNFRSNLVDLIVGASFVLIAYCSGSSALLPVHYLLAVFYVLWLVVLKPRSSSIAAEAQALVAVFLGTTAATLIAASADSLFLVVACFVIGFSAAHHVLVQTEDETGDFRLVALACGLASAELAWLCHGWLIVYTLNGGWIGNTGIIIPQLSLLLTLFAFLFGYCYKSIQLHDGRLQFKNVAAPAVFTLLIVFIVVIWFSRPIFNV